MNARKPPPDMEYHHEGLGGIAHWREAFDSRYLRYTALGGRPKVVTITDVGRLRSVSKRSPDANKQQLLIQLKEFEKPWAANVTNCELIAQLYGDDPAGWVGKRIELYPTKTTFGRETVDCMRVRPSVPAAGEKPKAELSEAVRGYCDTLAKATTLEAINDTEVLAQEDQALTDQEAVFVRRAASRRRTQLGEAPQ